MDYIVLFPNNWLTDIVSTCHLYDTSRCQSNEYCTDMQMICYWYEFDIYMLQLVLGWDGLVAKTSVSDWVSEWLSEKVTTREAIASKNCPPPDNCAENLNELLS